MFAIIIGGALGGLVGAILALPVAAAGRDVVRYLFRRVGPDEDPAGSRRSCAGSACARTETVEPGVWTATPAGGPEAPMPDRLDPYKILQVDPRPRTRSSRPPTGGSRASTTPIWPGRRRGRPDGGHQRGLGRSATRDARRRYDPDRRILAHADDAAGRARARRGPRRRPVRQAAAAEARPTSPHRPDRPTRCRATGRRAARRYGGGYDASMHEPDGLGAAGPPPGRPSGSVLNFGRYAGWSIGEIGRQDIEYLEWLDRAPIGRQYREEIDGILRRTGRRRSAAAEASDRRGLFRRR